MVDTRGVKASLDPVGVDTDPGNGADVLGIEAEDKSDVVVRLTLKGITPLMMHQMSAKDIETVLLRGERAQPQKDLPLRQLAEKGIYKDEKGNIGIPSELFFACLREGGRFVKLDARRAISTAETTTLPSLLWIEELFLVLDADPWVVDIRKGVMKSGGKVSSVAIVRPKFNRWQFTVTLHVNMSSDGIPESKVRKLVEMAGRRAGLCSFRPLCNGPFGQFVIEKWEVVPQTA